jgi:hypothetical protein
MLVAVTGTWIYSNVSSDIEERGAAKSGVIRMRAPTWRVSGCIQRPRVGVAYAAVRVLVSSH